MWYVRFTLRGRLNLTDCDEDLTPQPKWFETEEKAQESCCSGIRYSKTHSLSTHVLRWHAAQRYWVEEAEAPFRCRLQRDGLKFSRDIAKWEARAPEKKNDNDNDNSGGGNRGGELDGDEYWGGEGGGGDGGSGSGGGSCGGDGAGFFAFPLVVHNSHAHHVVRENVDATVAWW